MTTLLALLIIALGGYLAVFNPVAFVVLYGVTAAGDIACGISYFISSGFSYFRIIMQLLLFTALFFSFQKCDYKLRENKTEIILCIILMLWIAIVSLVSHFDLNVSFVGNVCNSIANLAPIYLLIFLLCKKTYRVERYFLFFLGFHTILAFLIIYLPTVGIDTLEPLRAAPYLMHDNPSVRWTYDITPARWSNALSIFTKKYAFNQSAHFHNPNDTGFVGAVSAFVFLQRAYCAKNHRVPNILLALLGVVLWFNSGMRGPILGIVFGCIVYILWSGSRKKKLIAAFVAPIFLILSSYIILPLVLSLLHNESIHTSFHSRYIRRVAGLRYISENLLWGNKGQFTGLLEHYIDPHELPLRMTVLFGIVAGILIVFIVYLIPCKKIIFEQKKLYEYVFFFIMLAVSLTNNYTVIILFCFLLYISAFSSGDVVGVRIFEKNIIHRKIRTSK